MYYLLAGIYRHSCFNAGNSRSNMWECHKVTSIYQIMSSFISHIFFLFLRSSLDIERRLDRFECVIVTRGGSLVADAGAMIARATASLIQIAQPSVFVDFEVSSELNQPQYCVLIHNVIPFMIK